MVFEFKLPDIGEGVVEGEIVNWKVKPGDTIIEDQILVEVMTDKATVEIPSPRAGKVIEIYGIAGEKMKVGTVLLKIDISETETISSRIHSDETKLESFSQTANVREPQSKEKVLATPAIRRMARELNIDLSQIKGSGEDGRILKEDVMKAQANVLQAVPKNIIVSKEETKVQRETQIAEEMTDKKELKEERVPYIGVRRKIGEHMQLSKTKIPHFSYVDEVDMGELVETRKKLLPVAEKMGVKLTYLPFIIKALLDGLIHFPLTNSSLDENNNEIIVKKYYHIGIATATEKGLVVPVVKNADKLKIFELAVEIERITVSARNGKIALEDLKNSTFSITNVGSIGGLFSSPIINYPEVGIMGIHKIHKRPVVKNDQIGIRDMMYISFSFDHRVVDGALAAEFAQYIIERLESPGLIFLDLI